LGGGAGCEGHFSNEKGHLKIFSGKCWRRGGGGHLKKFSGHTKNFSGDIIFSRKGKKFSDIPENFQEILYFFPEN
jgi:hypothetical protein